MGTPIFLTWRLYGSLPQHRVFAQGAISPQAFLTMDSLLDHARTGPRYLCQPEIASIVMAAIRHGETDLRLYSQHAYAIMPNHVHLLITPRVEIAKVTHSLKRHTARMANQSLGRTGASFWQPETYDHLVRDAGQFRQIQRYIVWNPVKAGLATSPEQFPFAWSESDC